MADNSSTGVIPPDQTLVTEDDTSRAKVEACNSGDGSVNGAQELAVSFEYLNDFTLASRFTVLVSLKTSYRESNEQHQMSSEMRNMSLTANNTSEDNVETGSKPVTYEDGASSEEKNERKVRKEAARWQAYRSDGLRCFHSSDFQTALKYFQLQMSTAKEMEDKGGEGDAYGNLGCAYYSLCEFEKAIENHLQHLNVAKQAEDKHEKGRAYANLGIAYDCIGDFNKAIEYHLLHLDIVKETGDKVGEGRACGNLGNAYHQLGEYEKAKKFHEQHLTIAKEEKDVVGEGFAYANLGIAYVTLGDFKTAIKCHQLHLSITKALRDRAGEGGAYANLAVAYHKLGDFKTELEYLQLHLSITKGMGDRAGVGRAYGNLGVAYCSLGDFEKSKEYNKLHLRIAKQVGDKAGEGRAYTNLGNAYYSLGTFSEAIECYQQHISIAKELEDRPGEGDAYANLANAHKSLGEFQKAKEYNEHSLTIFKEVGDRAKEGSMYSNLGNDYLQLRNVEKAIENHKLHLSIATAVEDRVGEATAYCNLGNVYCSVGDLDKAEYFYKLSVQLFDNLRDQLHSKDDLKINLRNLYGQPYTALWNVLLEQNKTNEALLTAERGRGQALMDLMESQYGLNLAHPGPGVQIGTLSAILNYLSKQMGTISDILKYISSPTVFLAVGTDTINFWVLKTGEEPTFVQKKIDKKYLKENAVNSLESLNDDAYAKIGVLDTVKCDDRSFDEQTEDRVADQRHDGKGLPSSDCEDDVLKVLYDIVISPIAEMIQGDEVTIVPDGPLLLAPFPAFKDQNSRYLAETFSIRLIPTLTSSKLMATERPEQHHSTSDALLVGDPWVGSVRIKTKRLPQLPSAKAEVEMIGKILKTDPLTGEAATKSEVLSRLNSAALVHIAAHGKVQTGEIALSPNPTQSRKPKEEDYLLTMEDVLNSNLQAKLVVLSCCHSGRGKVKAEGVVGIARAFLGAGAKSVLASLWALDDEASHEFMKHFYTHLEEGQSTSKSLNRARKCMRESEKFSDVKHWAPFVLIGNDVTFHFGQTSNLPAP